MEEELLCPETEIGEDSLNIGGDDEEEESVDSDPTPVVTPTPAAKKYRLEARSIFYTWPKCKTAKETVLHNLVQDFKKRDIKLIIVCQEQHKDGEPHLHALTVCDRPRNCSVPSWADKFAGKHGDYQSVRDVEASVKYIQKKGDWIVYPEDFDFEKEMRQLPRQGRKRKVSEEVADKIHAGTTYRQLLLTGEYRGFIIHNSRKIQDYEADLKRAKAAESAKDSLVPWRSVELTHSMSLSEISIVEWMNKNLNGQTRPLGTCQLYLYGPTGLGKTHLMTQLRRYFRVYDVCMEEEWMDNYEDEEYDLILFEEFRGQKAITWMNKFIDGQIVPLRRRGKSAYIKTKNTPVIILSNYSVEKAYKNSSEEKLAPLIRRLTVVNVGADHSQERQINIL